MNIDIIKAKCGEHAACGDEGRYVWLDCTNALLHLLLMLATMHMREREVVSSAVAQDFVPLLHQRNECVVECAGRNFVLWLPNCLDKTFHVFYNNFLAKVVEGPKKPRLFMLRSGDWVGWLMSSIISCLQAQDNLKAVSLLDICGDVLSCCTNTGERQKSLDHFLLIDGKTCLINSALTVSFVACNAFYLIVPFKWFFDNCFASTASANAQMPNFPSHNSPVDRITLGQATADNRIIFVTCFLCCTLQGSTSLLGAR